MTNKKIEKKSKIELVPVVYSKVRVNTTAIFVYKSVNYTGGQILLIPPEIAELEKNKELITILGTVTKREPKRKGE